MLKGFKRQFIAIARYMCVAVFLSSCAGKDVAYEKTYTFANNCVDSTHTLLFEFEHGKDSFQLYNIVMEIAHLPQISYTTIPFDISYQAPSGEQMGVTIGIPVYDKKYKLIGKMQKDSTVVLEETLFSATRMREGRNTFIISPAAPYKSLLDIQSITLRWEKAN